MSRRKAPWRPLPESAVPLSRQHAVRDAVAKGADLLGIPTPKVVITPTKSVGRTRMQPPESIRIDSYLAARAPIPVVQALVAHEVGHLAPGRPSDRGSRMLAVATMFVTALMAAGMVWVGITMGPAFVHHPALLGFYGVLALASALLVASRRMVRPLERAADAVSVDLVGSEAFLASRCWVATHYHPGRQSRLAKWIDEALDTHPSAEERMAMARALNRPPGPLLEAMDLNDTGEDLGCA